MKKHKLNQLKVMKKAMKSKKIPDDDDDPKKKGSDGKGGKNMKRPAAATGKNTIADAVKEMERGVGEESEQEGEEKRDKGKAEKFKAMRGQLPSHILNLYDEAANSKSSPRAFRTQLVNALFDKTASGRYVLRDDKPMFVEHKALYEKRYNKDAHVALPRGVMLGLYFHNSYFTCIYLLIFVSEETLVIGLSLA